jgi:hypothetical protein
MIQRYEQPELRTDLIDELRALALRGAKTKDMLNLIHARLPYGEPAIIPALAYITRAFCIPLREALPLRELIGTELHAEMDDVILPALERAKQQWAPRNGESCKTAAAES